MPFFFAGGLLEEDAAELSPERLAVGSADLQPVRITAEQVIISTARLRLLNDFNIASGLVLIKKSGKVTVLWDYCKKNSQEACKKF
jgi:hypothetical protein